MTQQGDVLLYQTNDDGDITVENGQVTMAGGLETSAYLSLFGGNEQDDGLDGNPLSWWGNSLEVDSSKHYRSETQYLLRSIAAIPFNLRRIEDAATRDLKWMVSEGVATSIEVSAGIPGLNKVKLVVTVSADFGNQTFEFVENWKAEI